MATALSEYARFTAPFYETEQYQSADVLREYLREQERSEHAATNPEIDFFISMVETVDQLRYEANELYKSSMQHRSQNSKGPLPLPWSRIIEILYATDKASPPACLISYLAESHFSVIENLVHCMRKVLRQKREMTPIDRIQKLDATCLRWFSRQPGLRPEQKAGSSQKLLSVVKVESYDTLENRVFKDFLKKYCAAARRYCMSYKQKFEASSRYKAVRKLMALAAHALRDEHFTTVRDIYSVPAPNFVLQYDQNYNRIWRWYRLLLAKTRMIESLWSTRHVFTADFFKIVTTAYLRFESEKLGRPVFHSELRLRSLPENDGLLTELPFYNNLYRKGSELTELRDCGNGEIALIRNSYKRFFRCCYKEDGICLNLDNQTLEIDRTLPPDEAFSNLLQKIVC